MIETDNKTLKYQPIEVNNIKAVGFKFNNDFVKLLSSRIKEAEVSGRGLNILIYGDVKRAFAIIDSKKGIEYSSTIYDSGNINICDWDCSKAYNGKHKFLVECFLKTSEGDINE